MNDLYCPKCQIQFDEDLHQPRMFSNCGHTFCVQCLLDLIENRSTDTVSCFEEEDQCPGVKVQKGIDSFPINKFILQHLKKKQEQRKLSNKTTENNKICVVHKKIVDIVCLSDAVAICSDCALFGKHKSHEFLSYTNFQMQFEEKLSRIEIEVYKLKSKPFSENFKFYIETVKSKIKLKQELLKSEINSAYEKLIEEIGRFQEESQKSLVQIFFNFDKIVDELTVKCEQTDERKKELMSKLKESKQVCNNLAFFQPEILSYFLPDEKLKNGFEKIVIELDQIKKKVDEDILFKLEGIKIESSIPVLSEVLKKYVKIYFGSTKRLENIVIKNQDYEIKLDSCKKSNLKTQISSTKLENQTENNSPINLQDQDDFEHSDVKEIENDDLIEARNCFKMEKQKDIKLVKHRGNSFLKNLPSVQNQKIENKVLPKNSREKKSDNILVKNESESHDSMVISSQSEESMARHSKSFVCEKRHFNFNLLQNSPPKHDLEDLSKSYMQSKRKGSFTPKKDQKPRRSLLKSRDPSPCFPKVNIDTSPEKNILLLTDSGLMSPDFNLNFEKKKQQKEPFREFFTENSKFPKLTTNFDFKTDSKSKIVLQPRADMSLNSEVNDISKMRNDPSNRIQRLSEFMTKHENSFVDDSNKFKSKRSILNGIRHQEGEYITQGNETLYKTTLDNRGNTSAIKDKQKLPSGKEVVFHKEAEEQRKSTKKSTLMGGNLQIRNQVMGKTLMMNEINHEITFADKKINDASLFALIPEILKMKKAKVLNLSNNFITDIGVEIIIKNLQNHPSLESVILKNNFIEERIFDVLKVHAKHLKRLNYFCMTENRPLKDRVKIKNAIAELKKVNIRVEI